MIQHSSVLIRVVSKLDRYTKVAFRSTNIGHMARSLCSLICSAGSHDPIELPHEKAIVVGRSSDTRIIDTRVSRNHVKLIADCEKLEVRIIQMSANSCEVEGQILSKGETVQVKDKALLYLLPGEFKHVIQFSPSERILSTIELEAGKPSSKMKRIALSDDDLAKTKRAKFDSEVISPRATEGSDSDPEEHLTKVTEQLAGLRHELQGDSDRSGAAAHGRGSHPSKKGEQESEKGEQDPYLVQVEPTVSSVKPEPNVSSVWKEHDKVLAYNSKGVVASSRIASYDIDGTIITTQSGKVFPTNTHDWKILLAEIPGKLKQLSASGYKIVFFSNQKGFQTGQVKPAEFKQKVENIVNKLGVPVQVFLSTGSGEFRKPRVGMWNYLTQQANEGIPVDVEKSFFVGDAAGRPKDWKQGKKKDFSCSDRLFALNIGLDFYTPEEHFLGEKAAKYEMPTFDPRNLSAATPLLVPDSARLSSNEQELILFVGCPASGKSHFVKKHLVPKGYIAINRDRLGTWQKCVQAAQDAIKSGRSVAVDNTNPDIESRKRYIDVAKAARVPCRCFVMNTSPNQAQHNERFREMTDKSHQPISAMVFNSFKSKYQEPTSSEGFEEIVKVNFIPEFGSSELESLYKQFLVEK